MYDQGIHWSSCMLYDLPAAILVEFCAGLFKTQLRHQFRNDTLQGSSAVFQVVAHTLKLCPPSCPPSLGQKSSVLSLLSGANPVPHLLGDSFMLTPLPRSHRTLHFWSPNVWVCCLTTSSSAQHQLVSYTLTQL